MTILALEFSSPQRSVAVIRKDAPGESPSFQKRSETRLAHASGIDVNEVIETGANEPFQMIDDSLRQSKLEREQIQCLAVGIGPGSYTGIRAAISIAQGWQLARGVKIIGISSAECIAAQAQADGLTGVVDITVDAQRGEFYLASYEITADSCREITPLKIVTMEDVRLRSQADELLVGPEISRWFAPGKTVFPRAAMLGKLALTRADFIAGEKLEPIYLRETKFVKAPPPRIIS
jgi:tRNA threonylcarbamoyl adenosine modification protein YeaZ